jgi:hypothetical protein
MRKIEELIVERIGEDLCLVFKTDGSASRGILGKIDPSELADVAAGFAAALQEYPKLDYGAFRHIIFKV